MRHSLSDLTQTFPPPPPSSPHPHSFFTTTTTTTTPTPYPPPPDPPSRRHLCVGGCDRPLHTCLCSALPPAGHPLPIHGHIFVLQHPSEQKKPLNTVPLLTKCIRSCQVIVGRKCKCQDFLPLNVAIEKSKSGEVPMYLLYPAREAKFINTLTRDCLPHYYEMPNKMLEENMDKNYAYRNNEQLDDAFKTSTTPSYYLIAIDASWKYSREMYALVYAQLKDIAIQIMLPPAKDDEQDHDHDGIPQHSNEVHQVLQEQPQHQLEIAPNHQQPPYSLESRKRFKRTNSSCIGKNQQHSTLRKEPQLGFRSTAQAVAHALNYLEPRSTQSQSKAPQEYVLQALKKMVAFQAQYDPAYKNQTRTPPQ